MEVVTTQVKQENKALKRLESKEISSLFTKVCESVCTSCCYKTCQYNKEIEIVTKQLEEQQDETPFKIEKAVSDRQLVFGWANVCKTKDGEVPLDWSGDVMSAEILEPAAYAHVLKYRATGERHRGEAKGILVESVMFTKEKMQAMGIPEGIVPEGWWVGYYIPDANVFAKIKSGEYKMFSIQGGGIRRKVKENG